MTALSDGILSARYLCCWIPTLYLGFLLLNISEFTLSVVGSYRLTLPQLNSHFFAARNCIYAQAKSLDETLHLSLQECYCLPVLTYAVAAISLSVRQENELNACCNSVYRKLFVFTQAEICQVLYIRT